MSKQRSYLPCRVCGASHSNPRSSSLCPSCGKAAQHARIEAEAEMPTKQDELMACQTIDDLKNFIYRNLV